jgi:hypothetical protein
MHGLVYSGSGSGGGGEAVTTSYSPNGGGDATLGTPNASGYRTISGTGLDGLTLWDPGSSISGINDDGSRFRFTKVAISGGQLPFGSWQYLGNDKGAILILGQPGAFSSAIEATISATSSTSTSNRAGVGIWQPYPASVARNNSAGTVVYGQASSINANAFDDGVTVATAATGPALPATVRTEFNYDDSGTFRTAEIDFKYAGASFKTFEGTPYSGSSWLGLAFDTIVASTWDVTALSVTA